MASEVTFAFVKSVLAANQLVPSLVERKTPLPVPAKRFVSETAKVEKPGRPELAAFQFAPLLWS